VKHTHLVKLHTVGEILPVACNGEEYAIGLGEHALSKGYLRYEVLERIGQTDEFRLIWAVES
jgi:hypothetical protein